MAERDYVAEATEQGWDPNYEGENKVDAQTFVEKGEKIAGILKSKNERLEGRVQVLESANQAHALANKEFGNYKDGQLAKEKRKSADLLAQLETQRATAITDADGAEFTRLDREIQQVRQDLDPPSAPSNGGGQNPLYDAWLLNNEWYNTDPVLRTFADGLDPQVASEGYTGPAYYLEITRRAKEAFPDKFENKRRSGAPSVEKGGELETKPDSAAHIYENLPPEAKSACNKFVASGHTTKESYCENFDWD